MKIFTCGLAVAAGVLARPQRAVADAPRASPTAPHVTAFPDEEFAAALLAETNRVRRAHGRRPFLRRSGLEGAAADQAGFMVFAAG